ncbi:MAG: LytTR family DNA-binding domain-containing protein [Balneolaceae bacterium]
MVKTIIVDDEEHARDRLSYMLEEEESIELVGVCKNGIEAIREIEKQKPDLIFLDIEMPELSGFDIISHIEVEKMPMIIFVTAFSEYAVKAFEVNALDYIHKPFDKSRLSKAVEKARNTLESYDEVKMREKLKELINSDFIKADSIERFVIKTGSNIYIVRASDVLWIEAAGNYVNIITENKKHLLRSTMSGLIERLDKKIFYQIHRSTIVNLNEVERVEEWNYGDFKVILKNGEELKMSRNYKSLIQSF